MNRRTHEDLGNPQAVIVLSGKRKSGKDYVANLLVQRFGSEDSVIIRLSGPLKKQYALENNLDYEKLLDASQYKEVYRLKMIHWGEKIRNQDPGYFCRHAILQSKAKHKNLWIVSDARRKTDVEFFLTNYHDCTQVIRVNAADDVRKNRGWQFTEGIDDCESECGLDDYSNWDVQLNNNNLDELLEGVNKIINGVKVD